MTAFEGKQQKKWKTSPLNFLQSIVFSLFFIHAMAAMLWQRRDAENRF